MSAIENARRQLSIYEKTLQQLAEQKAELGLYAPPFIISAIDELQKTIVELEKDGEPTLTPTAKTAGAYSIAG